MYGLQSFEKLVNGMATVCSDLRRGRNPLGETQTERVSVTAFVRPARAPTGSEGQPMCPDAQDGQEGHGGAW